MPSPLLRLLLLSLTSFFLPFASGQNLSSPLDLASLFRLRSSLGLRARDWPRRADPCSSWAGVACDSTGRVVSLNLFGLRRTRLARRNPRFAVEGIQNLTRLVSFNATGFALPGPIPNWFATLLPPSIAVIDLRRASVSGNIPFVLAGALAVLSLAENHITGNIPPSIGQLRNLSYLDLSSNRLAGSLPSEMGALRGLRTLILANNSLNGSIPDGLKELRRLRNLNLGGNLFSGSLGVRLFSNITRIEEITLSRNNFSGELPDSLWSLSKLRFLDVSYNNFTGSLPELSAIEAGGSFNLSHNLLYGSISSGFAVLLSKFDFVDLSDNYLEGSVPLSSNLSVKSNCFQNASSQRSRADCEEFYEERGISYDGKPISPPPSPSSSSSKSKNSWKYIVAAAVGGTAILVFLVICLLLLCFRWRRRNHSSDQREASPNAAAAPSAPEGGKEPLPAVAVNLPAVGEVFTFVQLASATSDFGEGNLIKHGKSGDIYQGVLENGSLVVVKRIDMSSVQKKEAYLVELDFFARCSHERLVPFVGHCLENENERFLVYRQMPHLDLANALYRKAAQEDEDLQSLDWITRLKIATGAAEALCYLHHECVPPLVHRDIQASSILLDDKFEVRLGSLSNVCAQEGDGHQNVISRLLRLSQRPEESASGLPPASWSYDVYCFGKVLLELVTGRLGVSGSNDLTTNEWIEHTLRFANIYEKELVAKIVDPSLIVDEDLIEEVWAMSIVAKSCLHPKPSKRPLMRYILKALENPLNVVREDNNSESARLKATSSRSSWNAAFFGSWRQSLSDIPSVSAPQRGDRSLRRSGTMRSQGSGGEHSFSGRRPSKEICPQPPDVDD